MLRVHVWVLCECYIWVKNYVQWMSQMKTNNDNNNNNCDIRLRENKLIFVSIYEWGVIFGAAIIDLVIIVINTTSD